MMGVMNDWQFTPEPKTVLMRWGGNSPVWTVELVPRTDDCLAVRVELGAAGWRLRWATSLLFGVKWTRIPKGSE